MRIIVCMMITVSLTAANGCSLGKGRTAGPGELSQASTSSTTYVVEPTQQSGPALLMIEEFSLTEDDLRLKYRVANVSSNDIWICTSQTYSEDESNMFGTDVRISNATLWMKRRANVEQNLMVDSGLACVRYRRLPTQQAWSDVILLGLPVRNISIVYEPDEEAARVVVNRLVLDVGYFDEDLPSLMRAESLRRRERGREGFEGFLGLSGGDPNVVFVPYFDQDHWDGLSLEESAHVGISEVVIPAETGRNYHSLIGGSGGDWRLWGPLPSSDRLRRGKQGAATNGGSFERCE